MTNPNGKLVSQYEIMFGAGYTTRRGTRVSSAYADTEIRKVARYVRSIFSACDVETVLDYGCGATDWHQPGAIDDLSLVDYFDLCDAFHFEPARQVDERRKVDCVVSFDVLEHVPLDEVVTVLEDISRHSKALVILNIACYSASAFLPNGENAHVTVRPAQWWYGQLEAVSCKFPDITYLLLTSPRYGQFQAFPPWRHADRLSDIEFVIEPKSPLEISEVFGPIMLRDAKKSYDVGNFEKSAFLISCLSSQGLTPSDRLLAHSLALAISATQMISAGLAKNILREVDPEFRPDLWHRMYLLQGNLEAAKRYRRKIEETKAPEMIADSHLANALFHLRSANYAEGFALYSDRSKAKNGPPGLRSLNGLHVPAASRFCRTIIAEQGVGDIALHLAHVFSHRDPKDVTLAIGERWHRFVCKQWPGTKAVAREGDHDPEFNLSGDYLAVTWQKTGKFAPPKIFKFSEDKKRHGIGIVWRGGSHQNRSPGRRMPLTQFVSQLDPSEHYFCLQHDVTKAEAHYLRTHLNISFDHRIGPGGDIADLIDVISGLSSFVAVDCSALHLCGLCGIEGIGYLPSTPHWYWGKDGSCSHLYEGIETRYLN